jgi:hypothetical protein
MPETYQRMIAVAGAGTAAAAQVKAALEAVAAGAPPGAVAVGEVSPYTADDAEPAPTSGVELERLRHATALGGVATLWRHTLNNSLAALLAEAQLLGMQSLGREEREGIERVITLCRRMIVVLREGPPSEPPVEPPT